MQFSLRLSALMLCAGVVVANTHGSCWCHNGGTYNWRVTTNACKSYTDGNHKWGTASYDEASGHCLADNGGEIAGKEFLAACRAAATAGFACTDGVGTCYADAGSVGSNCT